MGFDIDSCCALYDGRQLLCLPRFRRAVNGSFNLVDPSRRSPSYESRLRKYALRGFAVAVPAFDPSRVDANIFVGDAAETEGLGRLLLHAQEDAKDPSFVPRPFQKIPSSVAGLDGEIDADDKVKKEQLEESWSCYTSGDEPRLLDFGPCGERTCYQGGPAHHINRYLNHCVKKLEVGAKLPFLATTSIAKALTWPKDQILTHLQGPKPDYITDASARSALAAKQFTSACPSTIEFITQDPGRQYVTGSFEPEDRDWYASAYGELPSLPKE